jgi:UDP-N-acetylglucosamine/UDP-N-acetylgalactosamine diphosphorylase
MTSPATHAATLAHWAARDWYGLGADTVHVFCQATIPAVDARGRVLLATPSSLVRSPNGNGGVYAALATSGALDEMEATGVEAVDIVCVDNALARGGDPAFVGACLAAGAAVGCRALARASPHEKVGVFAAGEGGRLRVLEYSELPPADAAALAPDGATPLYPWANICMHYATPAFLRAAAADLGVARPLYHAARKPVRTVDGGDATPAIKLELFIFDAFDAVPAADVAVFSVDREEAFAPVKGATGADTPADARRAVLAQGKHWVEAAGGSLASSLSDGIEVTPATSYAGEGLEGVVGGAVVAAATI